MKTYTVIEQHYINDRYIVNFRGTYSSENNAMRQIVSLKKNELYDHIHLFINCLKKKDDSFVYYYERLKSFLDNSEDINDIIDTDITYQIIETEIDNPLNINVHGVKLSVQNIDLSIIQKSLSQEDHIKYYKEKKNIYYLESELSSIHIDNFIN